MTRIDQIDTKMARPKGSKNGKGKKAGRGKIKGKTGRTTKITQKD